MKFNEQKAHKCAYFCVKNVINQTKHMIVCGAAAIFSAIMMSDFTIATKIMRRRKMTRYCPWNHIVRSPENY